MKFYRLEKPRYLKEWLYAIVKSVGLALLITIGAMLICGYKFMIVSSGSMLPKLPVGSLVIVTPCDVEDLDYNDIVTMDANGIYLTHRIIGKYRRIDNKSYEVVKPGEEGYDDLTIWVTKGDNSDTIDGPLTKDVVGVVQENHCFTWVGDLVSYIKANYIMLIVLLILLFLFVEVIQYLKSKLEQDDIECYESEDTEE